MIYRSPRRRAHPRFFAMLVVAGALLFPPVAQAAYEQVPEHFAGSGEASAWLESKVQSMAVNPSGAGGVQPGTFYAATQSGGVILRFSPGTEGEEPQFQEAWGWNVGSRAGQFQRCGPALSTDPAKRTFHTCDLSGGGGGGGEQPGHFEYVTAVAVDQSNGDVYVRNGHSVMREHNLIQVFTATGTAVGSGFGDAGDESSSPRESIAEGPSKLHSNFPGGMAVDDQGTVYLTDWDYGGVAGTPEYRVMSFEPQNGTNFEHYVYRGRGQDLLFSSDEAPSKIALAGGNRLVTAKSEQLHTYALVGGAASPICSLQVSGNLTAMTANPVTGEVFYYTEVKESVFRLTACNEATGTFTEIQKIKLAPSTEIMSALAVDPVNSWSPLRPAGIVYAPSSLETVSGYPFSGDILAFSPILIPAVVSQSVTRTGATTSTLQARVDPRGSNTFFTFEYLAASTYAAQLAAAEGEGKTGSEAEDAAFAGAVSAPSTPGRIESGAIRTGTVNVGGLAPDTAYRFRAVVTSFCEGEDHPLCEGEGRASLFTTYAVASSGLPDGRAYELVSPAKKEGGEVFPADSSIASCGFFICKPPGGILSKIDPMQSAPDGKSVAYMGYAFSGTEGAPLNSYISRRTSAGWQTIDETPASEPAKAEGVFAYSSGLEEGAVAGGGPQILLRDTAAPFAQTGMIPSPRYRAAVDLAVEYGGYSPDFSAQLFSANDSLTSATADAPEPPDPGLNGRDLYEWTNGSLSLVNVLPGNTEVAEGATFASLSPYDHGISQGGSKVFWTAGGHLYARVDGTHTIDVGTSQRSPEDPTGHTPVGFIRANSDGSRVLLSGSEELTEDANNGLGQEVILSASAGTFKLSFEGQNTGGTGSGDLIGPGAGTGTMTKESFTVSNVTVTSGAFQVEQEITGEGIPSNTTIVACSPSCATPTSLTLSKEATVTSEAPLSASSSTVFNVHVSSGEITKGEVISGAGVPAGATVVACLPATCVNPTSLTLSAAATASGTGVALSSDLGYKSGPEDLRYAVQALPTVGEGNALATTGPEGHIALYFTRALATNQTPLGVDGSGLTGTVSLRSFRPGLALYLSQNGTLTDLVPDAGSYPLRGVVGQADDLSRVYFVDSAKLPGSGANDRGAEAVAGEPNLYFIELGGVARFVATLAVTDGEGAGGLNDWGARSRTQLTAEASPDGRYLAFASTVRLTGYDNVGPCVVNENGTFSTPCREVFLYDSETGKLTCPSCNPTGEAPLGNSTLRQVSAAKRYFPQPRYVTDAGRLFFDSGDRLSPADTNGAVEDVYEYEPSGVGTCARAVGCVSLISPGTGTVDSNFLAMGGEGASEGSNVFFTTRGRLVPKDTDELLDLYDAREGGGFASESETQRAECQGESCQPVVQAPNDPAPTSAGFHGPGNVQEPAVQKCPKGKTRVKGKCEKKAHKKSTRHHKRKHRQASHSRRAGR